ncbi:MAG: hypothetical protein F6K35_01185 [Okeania sp. SIO2H7]|nr:hypothetical protein [Okeania sp. SIO2H7]
MPHGEEIANMTENQEKPTANESEKAPVSAQALAEVIQEFEQYRQR